MIDLSIIVPALRPGHDFLRCIASIRACLAGKIGYEIICVVPDVSPFDAIKGDDISILKETCPGIYQAMNQGVHAASGRYLYFTGQDDILLPTAADAVIGGRKIGADLIVSDVYWGGRGIFKNGATRHWLVWRNWCHQGVIYDRKQFVEQVAEFPARFKVQADHYANIVFCARTGLKITKHPECISWYASTGFSNQSRDAAFRQEFPAIVREHFGVATYLVVVLRRAALSIRKRGGSWK